MKLLALIQLAELKGITTLQRAMQLGASTSPHEMEQVRREIWTIGTLRDDTSLKEIRERLTMRKFSL
jgi:ribosomal protein L29